mmetsp:Transcript_3767/g.13190  ORF Transcript_3767/g.13190 Transcript_3767/m.13190 type:complete len:218 (-) Transcript_3767:861-1514(-)
MPSGVSRPRKAARAASSLPRCASSTPRYLAAERRNPESMAHLNRSLARSWKPLAASTWPHSRSAGPLCCGVPTDSATLKCSRARRWLPSPTSTSPSIHHAWKLLGKSMVTAVSSLRASLGSPFAASSSAKSSRERSGQCFRGPGRTTASFCAAFRSFSSSRIFLRSSGCWPACLLKYRHFQSPRPPPVGSTGRPCASAACWCLQRVVHRCSVRPGGL